ncbi:unnamed protein product [Rotaria socialis]|uniref:ZAD domain-containing protein n=1 Tax=Rotaria socialis TaxID=392032 RepID=A0A821B7A0_9BILA|nr:unnamed protein product [Rotaria socialis]CAF4591338.1 unnamed protein product [Rotaria socialis]
MKYKQLNPKSVRQLSTHKISYCADKHRVRCSLCDSLLKASTSHRYLLGGKSIHENLDKNITYNECCQRFLNGTYESDKLKMICLKCCQDLQRVYTLHKDAEDLTTKIRHTWHKTKRLNRARHFNLKFPTINENASSYPLPTTATDDNITITIKEELDIEQVPDEIKLPMERSPIAVSETVLANTPYDLSNAQSIHNKIHLLKVTHPLYDKNNEIIDSSKSKPRTKKQLQLLSKTKNINLCQSKQSDPKQDFTSYVPKSTSHSRIPNSHEYYPTNLLNSAINNQTTSAYTQLMINSSSPSGHPQQSEIRRCSSSTHEQAPLTINYQPSSDGEQSFSPNTNDDETSSVNGTKGTRLSRRQYGFLVKLPDQQSLNAFIETSSSESGSRWTWRRTSANSRGYKVYYVCNFSMRRHYHPCPAAMYALFHPEGSISIYSCGQHQHIPKDRLPVSITDATKDEIFKCLQIGMATTEIREHLTRLQLPFGDARKLNNFIKYHKELLRFGTVTNVRIGGTAYRQPQCWAIRRQTQAPPSTSTVDDDNNATTATTS